MLNAIKSSKSERIDGGFVEIDLHPAPFPSTFENVTKNQNIFTILGKF